MSSKRFILFMVAVFLLGAFPFLVVQPTGAASAGLSAGFTAPLDHIPKLLLLLLLGVWSSILPKDGMMVMPLGFLVMVLIGAALTLDVAHYPALRQFILGAILCFGLIVGMARTKITVFSVLISASFGFHYGMNYLTMVPSIASPMYYLLGLMIALALILAIAVAFGVTLLGDHEQWWEKLQENPRLRFLRSWFM
ncbi:MAG: HupE/UreJ family protein [Rickettsiales bacterium]